MKKEMLGEAVEILRILPSDQLKFFNRLRLSTTDWRVFQEYVHDQRQMKMDQIYRLRRPKTQDDVLKNSLDHEYYSGRIADMVILLQIIENSGDELERRARKEK